MTEQRTLQQLARLYGIQPAYYDVSQRLCRASPEALFRVLRTLGVPLNRLGDAAGALRERRQAVARKVIEPVHVAWDGRVVIPLRLPADCTSGSFRCEVRPEPDDLAFSAPPSEDTQKWTGDVAELPTVRRRSVEGVDYVTKRLALPLPLPWGYHQVVLELPGRTLKTLVISAPERAYRDDRRGTRDESLDPSSLNPRPSSLWGVFLPLYALHREGSWGAGDFSDLQALMQWVAEQGGSLAATLPLLATQWELCDDPSPYSPGSRLFWNEFYLDVTRVPELEQCPKALEMLNGAEVQHELQALREQPLVEYHRQMALKRKILTVLAESFFAGNSRRRAELDRFYGEHPEVEAYARFRAVGEQQGCLWPEWPDRMRHGNIQPSDYDRPVYQYHLYAQWQVQEQLQGLAEQTRQTNSLWYLDFPLGVSRIGYDVWRYPDLFGLDMSGGAPPDAFFTKGQNWGFPPLHPERLREQGYRYLRGALRRHLSCARLLRIDHVMSLYRLYWVPEGLEARDGVYVRYPVDEMFALLTLESHRHRARIVGENLGTVPAAVNSAMRRHGIQETYVLQYELNQPQPDPNQPAGTPSADSVASINTHDMPPFAAFWKGLDIDDRLDLGLLSEAEARSERDKRAELREKLTTFLHREYLLTEQPFDVEDVLQACLAWLGGSVAPVVLVNLEDLWGETESQNTPGTFKERCNWRRKARYTLEDMRRLPSVQRALAVVNDRRKRNPNV